MLQVMLLPVGAWYRWRRVLDAVSCRLHWVPERLDAEFARLGLLRLRGAFCWYGKDEPPNMQCVRPIRQKREFCHRWNLLRW